MRRLHGHACSGIADRDYRDDSEVERLGGMGVHVLGQSEIENVLLSEEVLRAVADHQGSGERIPELLDGAKTAVFRDV